MHSEYIAQLRAEASGHRPGTPDYEYRKRAAWKLTQDANGVPICKWTDTPPADFWADERAAA
jgi:hypothetical protein